MTAALDADLEVEGTGIAHRRDDVVHAGALHDHARAAVDHRVPHLARCVVGLVIGQQNPPFEVPRYGCRSSRPPRFEATHCAVIR